MKQEFVYHTCWNCGGKGYKTEHGIKTFTSIITLGILPTLDYFWRDKERDSIYSEECEQCRGMGIKKYKV